MSHTKEIIRMKLDTNLSGSKIARRIGITRQQVSYVLKKVHLPNKEPGKHCRCGKKICRKSSRCIDCYKASLSKHRGVISCACGCGETFEILLSYMIRKIKHGQKGFYSNHSHAGLHFWRLKKLEEKNELL